MKGAKGLVAKYASLTPSQLRRATKPFDQEMAIAKSRPLTAAEQAAWQQARRKPGRPRRGAGVKVISVSVERDLLSRADLLASALGISRAALIERGLQSVLSAGARR